MQSSSIDSTFFDAAAAHETIARQWYLAFLSSIHCAATWWRGQHNVRIIAFVVVVVVLVLVVLPDPGVPLSIRVFDGKVLQQKQHLRMRAQNPLQIVPVHVTGVCRPRHIRGLVERAFHCHHQHLILLLLLLWWWWFGAE